MDADSLARVDLLALGCLIGAGLIAAALLVLVIAGRITALASRRQPRPEEDRP